MQMFSTKYSKDLTPEVSTRPDFSTREPVVTLKFGNDLSMVMSVDEAKALAARLNAAATEHEEIAHGDA